ncbi:hypothetical protein BRC64_07280 [Halobacteriales archaeon QH_10_67_22]|nr:MAG: hypothetical protein BRC64_07280 [Halobacteriales archaeon QH_10_67_22]
MPTRRTVLAMLSAGLAGCSLGGEDNGPRTGTDRPPSPTPPGATSYWYTRPEVTGNRTLPGAGAIDAAEPVTFEPEGGPQWLVAHPGPSGSFWTVVTTDGRATRWRVRDGEADRVAEYGSLPAGARPVVATGEGVGDGRYALFTDTTDRYAHGALGDTTEGQTLTVLDPAGPTVDWQTTVGPDDVFEGLGPLVADFDGDGDPEIVTTVANAAEGARIAVFSTAGDRLATGPVHSSGWRHQLNVAPLGPEGRPELAVVRKPHVDRVLEFYRLEGGSLEIVATQGDFSTHTYGSRITDGALAADLDGDGRTEVLAPRSRRDSLGAVRRTADGARVAWQLTVDGQIGSNVTGVALDDGLAVGVGTAETVTVWQG